LSGSWKAHVAIIRDETTFMPVRSTWQSRWSGRRSNRVQCASDGDPTSFQRP
jgi:hypothetical protein